MYIPEIVQKPARKPRIPIESDREMQPLPVSRPERRLRGHQTLKTTDDSPPRVMDRTMYLWIVSPKNLPPSRGCKKISTKEHCDITKTAFLSTSGREEGDGYQLGQARRARCGLLSFSRCSRLVLNVPMHYGCMCTAN